MENIGDWLYVVIIIIAAVSSIFSSIRKKSKQVSTQSQQTGQSQQSGHTQQTHPREIFRGDVFDDDFWGDNTSTQQVPEKKPVPVVQQISKAKQSYQSSPKQSDFSFNKILEGQSAISKNKMDSIFADNEEEYASISLEDLPSETEEWRKALVYNEIFNRKY